MTRPTASIARATPEMRGRAIGLGYTARYSGDFINPLIVHPLGLAAGDRKDRASLDIAVTNPNADRRRNQYHAPTRALTH